VTSALSSATDRLTSANSVGVLVEQYADRGASLGVRASFNPPIRARCLTTLGGRYVGVLHGSAGNVAWLEAALCECGGIPAKCLCPPPEFGIKERMKRS
jgi:hypothetical protein